MERHRTCSYFWNLVAIGCSGASVRWFGKGSNNLLWKIRKPIRRQFVFGILCLHFRQLQVPDMITHSILSSCFVVFLQKLKVLEICWATKVTPSPCCLVLNMLTSVPLVACLQIRNIWNVSSRNIPLSLSFYSFLWQSSCKQSYLSVLD